MVVSPARSVTMPLPHAARENRPMTRRTPVFVIVMLAFATTTTADEPRKKIVLLAGPKSHGPVGNGVHDYGWSARLIKMMLETSAVKDKVRVETHPEGWPRDSRSLEDADVIMVISDGRDGDKYADAPHLASEERVWFIGRQIKRGCGFLTFHFSTFAPQKYSQQIWIGAAVTSSGKQTENGSGTRPSQRLKP